MKRAIAAAFVAVWLSGCAARQTPKGGLVSYAPEGVSDQAAEGRQIALVIGINDYRDDLYTDLRFAVADATAVGAALAHYDRVEILTTPEQVTQAGIRAALDRLAAEVRGPNDTVMVYLSGHGTLGRTPGGPLERFLVPSDADSRAIDRTGMPVSELVDRVESLAATKKGVVLAACYNGKEKSALTEALAAELASQKGSLPPLMQRSEAMIVTSAASFGEAAIEDADLGHDVYTWFWLEGLEKGDRDADGAVTLTEAHDYARDRTYAFTEGRQRPSARATVLGRDPIVLAGDPSGSPPPLLYSYDDGSDGLSVVLNGQTKGVLPGGIPVDPGVHRLQLTDDAGRVVHARKIRIEKGDRVSLSELVVPRASFSVRPGVQMWSALGAASHVWPTTAGPGLALQWRGARTPLLLGLDGGVHGARDVGRADRWRLVSADLSVGWSLLDHPVVDVRPLVTAGAVTASWQFPLDWTSRASGTIAGGGLQLALRPFGDAEIVADGRLTGSVLDLSDDVGQLHGNLRAGVSAGWTF